MGTTLANLHILRGDEQQLRTLLPKTKLGRWSANYVSVYSQEFTPGVEKTARALSKKLAQPVFFAWLFDSDAVGFAVYQNGKAVARHIINPDGDSKMGNIALFCETLGLSPEDVPRLQFVWKKGDAEEQLELTALLLGLPLYYDYEVLPDKQHIRDTDAVDKWIAERPAPLKIKSETKAVLLQELTDFFLGATHSRLQSCYVYCKVYDKFEFWKPDMDGIIHPYWSTIENLHFQVLQDRILGMQSHGGMKVFDSAGLLPEGYEKKCDFLLLLPDGGLLWEDFPGPGGDTTIKRICCAPDGSELWRKSREWPGGGAFFACENGEIIFTSNDSGAFWVERVEVITGDTIERLPRPFGRNDWNKAYHNGFWWVSHDGNFLKYEKGNTLTKLDDTLRPLAELPLPNFTQELFFSPDNVYIYVSFYKSQIMVVNTETLAIENVLNDKSLLIPLGFDSAGRFWLQRDNSTVEAWDAKLKRPLSRHKLKGKIVGYHKDSLGVMCVVAWSGKAEVLRVYKMASLI